MPGSCSQLASWRLADAIPDEAPVPIMVAAACKMEDDQFYEAHEGA